VAEPEDINGRLHGEQFEPEQKESLLTRLIYMILIAVMISVAQTVLATATVLQFIILAVTKEPNPRLADFGTDLGIWIAKAARYQMVASSVKPWPWTELD
jgi:succinate-acetate transporter protein